MSPDSAAGRRNRALFTSNFGRLSKAAVCPDHEIVEFGSLRPSASSPEKRVSANFLTTRLKVASQGNSAMGYPSRPAPVLQLGSPDVHRRWLVSRHIEWRTNLAKCLMGTRSKTPFADLAVVVLRDVPFEHGPASAVSMLSEALQSRFSKVFTSSLLPFIRAESVHSSFPKLAFQKLPADLTSDVKAHAPSAGVLLARVKYLESILIERGIPFNNSSHIGDQH